MKGFSERALVSDVLNWLRQRTGSTGSEEVVAAELLGRILEDAVVAGIDVPSFDRSAMDGYAVQAESTDGASLYNPLSFSITGQALPGTPHPESVDANTAVRIMTGAPVPDGATCVVPANRVELFAELGHTIL